jgi:hypothetical protein
VWVGHGVEQFPSTRGQNVKTEKNAITPLILVCFFRDFYGRYLATSYILWVFDLTYFSRSQRSKFIYAHLDDAYAITEKIFDIDFWP